METMRAGMCSGAAVEDWVVFTGPEGGYQMIAGYEGTLDSLAWERGARQAWRMVRRDGEVFVEGREGMNRCEVRSPLPRSSVRNIVPHSAVYAV